MPVASRREGDHLHENLVKNLKKVKIIEKKSSKSVSVYLKHERTSETGGNVGQIPRPANLFAVFGALQAASLQLLDGTFPLPHTGALVVPADAEEAAVDQHQNGDGPLEGNVLGDVVDQRPTLVVVRSRRKVKRLGDLQSLLQVAPTALVDGEQRRALVLAVVGNDDADEERQADHAAEEDEDVNVDGVKLVRRLVWCGEV